MGTMNVDDFRVLIQKTEIKCLECGWSGHSLVVHLREKHGLSPGQYKNKFSSDNPPLASKVVTEVLKSLGRQAKYTDKLDEFQAFFATLAVSPMDDAFVSLRQRIPAADPAYAQYATVVSRESEFFFPSAETSALMVGLILNKNAYLSGPTGCGKTELCLQLHQRLGKPILRMNMHGDATASNFIGAMRVDPARGTYFRYGALPHAMLGGMTLLLDEVDYTPPQIAALLNPVLEGSRRLLIEETDEIIEAHPGFRVMATGNTGGKSDSLGVYAGTEVLNTAFLDRFAIKLTIDYLPEDVERRMLAFRFPSIKDESIHQMVRFANEVRVAFRQGKLSITMSTRKLIDYFQFTSVMETTDALAATLFNWLDEDDLALVNDIARRCGVVP